MANRVEVQFITNARQIRGELYQVNAYLHNIQDSLERMNMKAVTGHQKHGHALRNLALRFVGYQYVLNQVMSLQQKFISFIQESVQAYREFEMRMAEVSTILGSDTINMLSRLTAGVEMMSIKYGQATSDMAKGLYDILSAAFEAKDALNLLNTATKASIAGLSDVRTSVDIFTTVLNSYGMAVEQASRVSDVLFQSVIRGKFQFVDLESALGYVVPIASQAGIAFEELMAALSTTTRHGLHLDMTARGLALAIQNIINPTAEAAEKAKEYGIEMNGLALRVMGLYGWFEELGDAVDVFGKNIIGELIRNMRSLRTAMVLAGEEGLGGFREDLQRLADMGNTTEIALEKIMDTSQFTANQLTQALEKEKREMGEQWDDFLLNLKRGFIEIVRFINGSYSQFESHRLEPISFEFKESDALHNAKEYLRIQERLTELEELRNEMMGEMQGNMDKAGSFAEKTRVYLSEETREKLGAPKYTSYSIKEVEDEMAKLIDLSSDFEDSWNDIKGSIMDAVDNLGDLELNLMEIELDIEKYQERLRKPMQWGWGETQQAYQMQYLSNQPIKGTLYLELEQLRAKQRLADATHDVNSGLENENYQYKMLPPSIQEAVAVVREFKMAQDELKKSTDEMSTALRLLQIKALEIQLKGMIRRRGLTRNEQKELKKIQIAQAKLRLENMKDQATAYKQDLTTYSEKQELIDDYLAKIEEENYQIHYSYDQQITDLENAIQQEETSLQTRYDWWAMTNKKIVDSSSDMIKDLNVLLEEEEFTQKLKDWGIEVEDLIGQIEKLRTTAQGREAPGPTSTSYQIKETFEQIEPILPASDMIRDFLERKIPGFEQGTSYVQETGLALVHEGERITPGSRVPGDGSGNTIIQNVNINVREVADVDTVEKLTATLSAAESAGLIRNGKTTMRPR